MQLYAKKQNQYYIGGYFKFVMRRAWWNKFWTNERIVDDLINKGHTADEIRIICEKCNIVNNQNQKP
jgi:adenine/guanine phosphoribosyltransferase-like PRPP-binding protein